MKKIVTKFLKFGEDKIEKIHFRFSEYPIDIYNVDAKKIIVLGALEYRKNKNAGATFFVRFKDNAKIRPLNIKLYK